MTRRIDPGSGAAPRAPAERADARADISALSTTERRAVGTLALLGIVSGSVWAVAVLADLVRDGTTQSFDERVLLALRDPVDRADPLGPKWLEDMLRDFTALGRSGVLGLVTFGLAGYLVLGRRSRTALYLVLCVAGALGLDLALKSSFDRARPALVPHAAWTFTTSFPSGHSLMSAATYLTLGALLARTESRRRIKVFVLMTAVIVVVLVGFSRVYLGVHWPTDVLAGWTIGAAWALSCWAGARILQRHGQLATDRDQRVRRA